MHACTFLTKYLNILITKPDDMMQVIGYSPKTHFKWDFPRDQKIGILQIEEFKEPKVLSSCEESRKLSNSLFGC